MITDIVPATTPKTIVLNSKPLRNSIANMLSNTKNVQITHQNASGDVGLTQCSKIGKKCNFKNAKKPYLHFQKWQKINFCTRKKFKITKNCNFWTEKKQDFW